MTICVVKRREPAGNEPYGLFECKSDNTEVDGYLKFAMEKIQSHITARYKVDILQAGLSCAAQYLTYEIFDWFDRFNEEQDTGHKVRNLMETEEDNDKKYCKLLPDYNDAPYKDVFCDTAQINEKLLFGCYTELLNKNDNAKKAQLIVVIDYQQAFVLEDSCVKSVRNFAAIGCGRDVAYGIQLGNPKLSAEEIVKMTCKVSSACGILENYF